MTDTVPQRRPSEAAFVPSAEKAKAYNSLVRAFLIRMGLVPRHREPSDDPQYDHRIAAARTRRSNDQM